jgi:hypothetical protein
VWFSLGENHERPIAWVYTHCETALALFGVFHPHDSRGEEDTGDRQREDGVGFVAIVDGHSGVNPPNHSTHEPDKGKIPHSHRGYLNHTGSQCDNSLTFHYFGNRI